MLFTSGCSLEEFDQTIRSGYKDTTRPKVSCEITKQYKEKYGYSYYIEGTCTNNSDKDYSYLQVEFICYDKEGYNLGTAWDNTSNLLKGEKWKFKAMDLSSDSDKIDHCEYHDVSGW